MSKFDVLKKPVFHLFKNLKKVKHVENSKSDLITVWNEIKL